MDPLKHRTYMEVDIEALNETKRKQKKQSRGRNNGRKASNGGQGVVNEEPSVDINVTRTKIFSKELGLSRHVHETDFLKPDEIAILKRKSQKVKFRVRLEDCEECQFFFPVHSTIEIEDIRLVGLDSCLITISPMIRSKVVYINKCKQCAITVEASTDTVQLVDCNDTLVNFAKQSFIPGQSVVRFRGFLQIKLTANLPMEDKEGDKKDYQTIEYITSTNEIALKPENQWASDKDVFLMHRHKAFELFFDPHEKVLKGRRIARKDMEPPGMVHPNDIYDDV